MSRGMGRAERWLLDYIENDDDDGGFWSWYVAEKYAVHSGSSIEAARATIRRAARTLEKRGLVKLNYQTNIDSFPLRRVRGRRTMAIFRLPREGEDEQPSDASVFGTPEYDAIVKEIREM